MGSDGIDSFIVSCILECSTNRHVFSDMNSALILFVSHHIKYLNESLHRSPVD